MKPTLLMFNISDPDKREKMAMAALKVGIMPKKIKKSDYRQSLAALLELGERSETEYNGPELPHEMLLLANMDDDQIQGLLDAFRVAGIPRINHKAVLTENNQSWNALMLYKELDREHEYFKQQQK
ncbi:MAG TPA: DUF3783 domain-containing protein [Syntrophomonas sp.]|nr:DUF3783 domain-containing protein [Syntrophomonas sp.]